MDNSLPTSSVPGILLTRLLEWVAIPFFRGSSWPRDGINPGLPHCKQILYSLSHRACMLSCFSHVQLFVTLWTVACQAPLSMGFSRKEHWSGLWCLPPGNLPDPGIKPESFKSPALTGRFFTSSTTWETPRQPISVITGLNLLTVCKPLEEHKTYLHCLRICWCH